MEIITIIAEWVGITVGIFLVVFGATCAVFGGIFTAAKLFDLC